MMLAPGILHRAPMGTNAASLLGPGYKGSVQRSDRSNWVARGEHQGGATPYKRALHVVPHGRCTLLHGVLHALQLPTVAFLFAALRVFPPTVLLGDA